MSGSRDTSSYVVGLGYVGLTLAVHLDRAGYETVGYDIDEQRIEALRSGRDPTGEIGETAVAESDISFRNSTGDMAQSDFVHVCLPTPIDESNAPDLSNLEAVSETVGRHISDGTVVVFESTLYPGATRERLRPALEEGATAQGGVAFSVGYSPERIVPAGRTDFSEAIKIVSAEDEATLDALAELYDSIVAAGVHRAESIETAEASKCLENAQRDVNIGLVNEFTMACRHLDFELDPHAVLEAARTKWNFHDFRPGIVGGHCIPVDTHYLRHKFEESGFVPHVLRSARGINEQMVEHVCSITVEALRKAKATKHLVRGSSGTVSNFSTGALLPEYVSGSRVLLLGFGYKPNVSDVRNSGAREVAQSLGRLGLEVSGYDPFHDASTVPESYDFDVMSRLDFDGVDAALVLTPHDEFRELNLETVAKAMNDEPVLVDVGNMFDQAAVTDAFTYRRL